MRYRNDEQGDQKWCHRKRLMKKFCICRECSEFAESEQCSLADSLGVLFVVGSTGISAASGFLQMLAHCHELAGLPSENQRQSWAHLSAPIGKREVIDLNKFLQRG
jgi:hypothetical protein